MDVELQFHLDMRAQDLLRTGLDEEQARRLALREFGDLRAVRDECRTIGRKREGDVRMSDFLGSLRQDLSFAGRQLVRNRGFSVLAAGTLALGIAATTVVFSVVNAVVLRPLPFVDGHELAFVEERTPQGAQFSMSEPNYLDFSAEQRSFTGMGAFTQGDRVLTGRGDVEELAGLRVTHTLFSVLRIPVSPGRGFLPEEDAVGGQNQVVLLSRGFWEERYGGDPAAVGATLLLDGEAHTVVGVVDTDAAFPTMQIFTPLVPDPNSDRGNHMIAAIGRLRGGTTPADAREDLGAIATRLAEAYPISNEGWGITILTLEQWRIGDRLTRLGYFLLAAVGLLLLMACASVSNLLIARATARQREIGLRAALGAGRGRIVRQLVTESTVLALVATIVGVALAGWAMPAVRALGPTDVARLDEARVDGLALGVSLAAAVVTVLLAGLLPAIYAVRGRLFEALREGVSSAMPRGRRVRDALVVAQFAIAVTVVLGAGLMLRSFSSLLNQELGFDPTKTAQMELNLPPGVYSDAERAAFVDVLEEAVAGVPGVSAVGTSMGSPFGNFRASNFVAPSDQVPDRAEDFQSISWRAVTAGFFDALGLEIVEGRGFLSSDAPPSFRQGVTDQERAEFQVNVIVDQDLAQVLWPNETAVGKTLLWSEIGGPEFRVVGITETVQDESIDGNPRPRLYMPYAVFPWAEPTLLVRSESGAWPMIPEVREVVREMAPGMPVPTAIPVTDAVANQVAWPRFSALVLSAFGSLALVLAMLGVYGVLSFTLARQRREIGIRIALGADNRSVARLVLVRGVALAGAGIVIGVLAALSMSRVIQAVLTGVDATDPMTYGVVISLLGVVTLAACISPAVRATRVDPRDALASD